MLCKELMVLNDSQFTYEWLRIKSISTNCTPHFDVRLKKVQILEDLLELYFVLRFIKTNPLTVIKINTLLLCHTNLIHFHTDLIRLRIHDY